ncbi:MAG: hypothetical protein AB1898_05205 [Acidobacteriota bacterium]
MRIRSKFAVSVLWLNCLLCTAGLAQGAEVSSTVDGLDYSSIKKDLALFQGVVDTTVKQNLQGPFPVLASTKGTYLPDYGALFNLEVNLYQIRVISPFDLRPHSQKELDEAYQGMLKRLAELKERLVKAMIDHGSSLQLLKPSDSLTLVVHLFGPEGDAARPSPSQVILKMRKSWLDAYRGNQLSFDELARKTEITQF